jgi:CheY-like chemotaxis protein
MLMKDALGEAGLQCDLRFVSDGEETMDYLLRRGRYASDAVPRPQMILLDLNMPKKGGLEVLAEIKSNPNLWQILVVVWTSSKLEADLWSAYDCGATAYVKKPSTFRGLVKALGALNSWWLETAALPPAQAVEH